MAGERTPGPAPDVEPWLRGPLPGVHPLLAPTLHAFAQAREDIARWTDGLTDPEMWLRPLGLAPIGFQLRHIAGSVERLTRYLEGLDLTAGQLDDLNHEMDPGPGRSALLQTVNNAIDESERVITSLDINMLDDPRTVGRKRLPTTVMGLVVHLAEHTQRHVGELIVTVKAVRKFEHGSTSTYTS
jgi:hypothetical protein